MREQPKITKTSQTKQLKFVIISDGTRSGTILMVDGVKIEDVLKISFTFSETSLGVLIKSKKQIQSL